MGAVDIRAITNADPDFYRLLGPFLSRRVLVNTLGGPIWDDDGKQWLVALVQGRVAGFCAYVAGRDAALLCNDYVAPDYRNGGGRFWLHSSRSV